MRTANGQLTRYASGSVQELWSISFPLILSILSINIMTFVDRLILSQYSIQAMNAAVVAGLVFSVFQYGTLGISAISEVFVGQYNGAQKHHKIGSAVWQMIWFSLATCLIFFPVGLFCGPMLIPNPEHVEQGLPFFKWMMLFGPAFPLSTALSSFFVGRGQVKLVLQTTLLSNLLNIILDCILIFGVQGLLSPLGASGAAIATGVSQVFQALLLLQVFLNKENRENQGTLAWQFNLKLFYSAFKIGLPNALSSIIELSAWCVLAQILASVSETHLTIFAIGDSFFVLFAFGFWGLQKGITTVVANYIGANREELIPYCLRSGIKIIFIIMLIFTIPLFFFPDTLVKHFINPEISALTYQELMPYAESAMRWLWVYFMLDAVAWLISGVLLASGDTKFVMIMNSISAWMFSIVPTYIMVRYFEGSPVITWCLCALYGLLNTVAFFLRYQSKRWALIKPLHLNLGAEV